MPVVANLRRNVLPSMYENQVAEKSAGSLARISQAVNPTFRESIDAKIQYHKDEIARLEVVREKMHFMLDVNLRDLREAMSF